jgi:hypothetical protein
VIVEGLTRSPRGILRAAPREFNADPSLGAPRPNGAADAAAVDAGAVGAKDASAQDGLVVSAATNVALDGIYALVVARFANGGDVAFNGALPDVPVPGSTVPRIELEVVTDAATSAIKRAHLWGYDAAGSAPDKFYGCDGSAALPCSGIAVDAANKKVTFASVVWKEVTADPTGATPDVVVAGAGSVTLGGFAVIQ